MRMNQNNSSDGFASASNTLGILKMNNVIYYMKLYRRKTVFIFDERVSSITMWEIANPTGIEEHL